MAQMGFKTMLEMVGRADMLRVLSHRHTLGLTPPIYIRLSSRHLRALLSVCGTCSFGGLGCCSCRVCVGVGGVVLCRCVCLCELLISLLETRGPTLFLSPTSSFLGSWLHGPDGIQDDARDGGARGHAPRRPGRPLLQDVQDRPLAHPHAGLLPGPGRAADQPYAAGI